MAIAAPPSGAAGTTREIHIGALLSLTGDGATLGTTSKAALEIAARRWNASPQGRHVKVSLDVENTNLDPDQAQAALTRLADADVPIVIGPQSSSEVAAISDTAASRGVLVVSQGSTASSLAQPDGLHPASQKIPTKFQILVRLGCEMCIKKPRVTT